MRDDTTNKTTTVTGTMSCYFHVDDTHNTSLIIVGGVIGGLVGFIVIIMVVFFLAVFLIKRQSKKSQVVITGDEQKGYNNAVYNCKM